MQILSPNEIKGSIQSMWLPMISWYGLTNSSFYNHYFIFPSVSSFEIVLISNIFIICPIFLHLWCFIIFVLTNLQNLLC